MNPFKRIDVETVEGEVIEAYMIDINHAMSVVEGELDMFRIVAGDSGTYRQDSVFITLGRADSETAIPRVIAKLLTMNGLELLTRCIDPSMIDQYAITIVQEDAVTAPTVPHTLGGHSAEYVM